MARTKEFSLRTFPMDLSFFSSLKVKRLKSREVLDYLLEKSGKFSEESGKIRENSGKIWKESG